MIIDPLFVTQNRLDDRILKDKNLNLQETFDERLLALQVEAGELINEWRGFKYWSKNQSPTTTQVCELCNDDGQIQAEDIQHRNVTVICPVCNGEKSNKNPMREEFVDCLHFILSIGNQLGYQDIDLRTGYIKDTPTKTFIAFNRNITNLSKIIQNGNPNDEAREEYTVMFSRFIELGVKQLGFTRSEIVDAYYEKNITNHIRQDNGY